MPLITLTSDFGLKDPLVASIKAKIYNELPDVLVVDISHDISPFVISEAVFVLKNFYWDFAEGSIHIIGVYVLVNPLKNPIAALIESQYFICAYNGILSLICA